MEGVTLFLAAAGCLLVLFLRPVLGLAVYVVLSMWYPYCVGTVSIGTVDFSVGRIVIIALFVKIFLNTDLASKFKVVWLDRLVVILFVAEVVAGLVTVESMKLLEYRSGDFFDMALPYFAVRLIITNRGRYITLLKAICWSVALLAVFGFYESLTGHNLVRFGRYLNAPEIRLNYFYRAQSTFRRSIYFGVFLAMAGALCMGLVKIKGNPFVYKILAALAFLGAFSSMSSGGLLAMVGAIGFIAFYRYRRCWKQGIVGLILMCGLVEIISNRHFYHVVDRFTFNSATAWYRTRLFEVAFFEGGMSDHWITGYGFEDPMWSEKIDMRDHTDMVNHYLMKLCRYGLVGFIPFCAVIITAIKKLFEGFWLVKNDEDTWLIWCVAAGLAGVLLAFNSVSLFGPPMTMLFMMFGFCSNMGAITVKV
ncbi:MAG: O-antigen ligase family protein [Planctomycetota bacterium]|nr:MAG: O-antigen ligase family protein [Planctomycetota bacterium]